MASDLYAQDHAGLMERLGRLQGSTTYRDQDSGGGTPFVTRGITSEATMLLALSMSKLYPTDVAPWICYSIALRIDDRKREIVTWLADKLIAGTGSAGKRNAHRMLAIAMGAYDLAIHGREPKPLKACKGNDHALLVNIGAGWLWVKCEGAVERAERAMGQSRRAVSA